MRVGLNAGEVVVRAIGNDLRMDYSAIGQTTHLAARMEQMAMPGTILLTPAVLGLAEGFLQVKAPGARCPSKASRPGGGLRADGAGLVRSRLQAAVARGLSRFVGRQPELEALQQALAQAQRPGQGQVVALLGEAGRGQVAPGLTSVLQAHLHPGLAAAGKRRGVLRQGHALLPGPATCSSATATSRTTMTSARSGPRSPGSS